MAGLHLFPKKRKLKNRKAHFRTKTRSNIPKFPSMRCAMCLPFIDTIVVCTFTVMVILPHLKSGTYYYL